MSSFIDLGITDAESVVHTFGRKSNNDFLARWTSDIGASNQLKPEISAGLREGSSSTARKTTVKVKVPYQNAAVDGVTPAIQYAEAIVTFITPLSAPEQTNENLVFLVRGSTFETAILDMVNTGTFVY